MTGLPSGENATVKECFEDYLKTHHETQGNALALKSRFNCLKKFWDTPVKKITSLDVQNLLYGMRYDYSADSISRVRLVWKDIFSAALARDIIKVNPLDRVQMPKSKKIVEHREQTCDEETINAAIHYFETSGTAERSKYNNRLTANLIILLKETGMRPTECYALSRDDLDFNANEIHIKDALGSTEEERWTVTATKTAESVRTIPMTTECESALIDLCQMSANKYIFTMYNGDMPCHRYFEKRVEYFNKATGYHLRLYTLRHRMSTNLITAGVDVRTVMELMGHASPSMTVAYARSNKEKKREALKYIDTTV